MTAGFRAGGASACVGSVASSNLRPGTETMRYIHPTGEYTFFLFCRLWMRVDALQSCEPR